MIVASKPYQPGDLIAEVKPLVYALVMPEKGKRCDSCFRRPASGATLKRCSRCLKVWYCNNDCQLSDWLLHKLECPLFVKPAVPGFHFKPEDTFFQYFLRLILLYKAKPTLFLAKHQTIDGELRSYSDLIQTRLPEDSARELEAPFAKFGLSFYLSGFGIEYDMTINRLLHVAILKNHPIFPPKTYASQLYDFDNSIASSLDLEPNHLISHSCRPSMFEVIDGRNTRLIAAKSIKIGEVLRLGHVYLCQSMAERGKQLLDLCLETCPCDRCEAGEDRDALGLLINYNVVNRLFDEPTDRNNYQRLLTMSKGNPKLIIDRIYANEHPEKTILLISLVKAEFALKKKGKLDASLIRATIKSMQFTMPNDDVMKFDSKKDDFKTMAQYLVEFAIEK